MHKLYNLSIYLYGLAINCASLFNPKAKLWVGGRRNWKNNLPKIENNRELIWFHCASLGEFDQGLPVMRALKESNSDLNILVTFFSPSGMLHYSKRNHCADYVCYLPLDTPKNALFFINHFSPRKIFFVKYEFWINFINVASNKGIPIYSISANFRANQHFFKWYGTFFRKTLTQFSCFFVQNNDSEALLNSIGIKNVKMVGDTRFDQVISTKNEFLNGIKAGKIDDSFIKIHNFLNGQKAIILGSSWPEEEKLIQNFILNTPEAKFIIAPHEISEQHIEYLENLFQGRCVRYTKISEKELDQQCLILDTIGHLNKAYYFGKLAIVGGGFTGKLHNILEPAVFGLPVLFGPKNERFPEVKLFLENKIAFEFENQNQLEELLKKMVVEDYSRNIELLVPTFAGASQKIVSVVN